MTSTTRRDFLRRGLTTAASMKLMNAGNATISAAPTVSSRRSHAAPSAGQGETRSEIVVTSKVIRQGFAGTGFHAQMFLDIGTEDFFDQVLAKRWRELNPRFARIFHAWAPGEPGKRDPKVLEALARQMVFMKEASGTEIYLTTNELKDTSSEEDRRSYASAVVDDLEYLLNRGATNLKYYCCTNELSLHEWADMHQDLPRFQAYHTAIADEIRRRALGIKLLATDASPTQYWTTIEWAAKNMDDISGVYGGHHYINEHTPDDLGFYKWFLGRCQWAVELAKAKGKDFILGEFGPAQYQELRYGFVWDTCKYYGMTLEGMAGLQLAEAAIAAINAGVYAMGYWTFTDYPERCGGTGINHWGVFKWLTNGGQTRVLYYAYGLLTKFFRGPATVYQSTGEEQLLRVAALQHGESKSWSIAVLNRQSKASRVAVRIEALTEPVIFRKYVYNPHHPPVTEDGDLQEAETQVQAADGKLVDLVEPSTLAVYTTAYSETVPAPVSKLKVTRIRDTRLPQRPSDANRLQWEASPGTDLCYYRVYHDGTRVGSTVGTEYIDAGPTRHLKGSYAVVAVNRFGNASPR